MDEYTVIAILIFVLLLMAIALLWLASLTVRMSADRPALSRFIAGNCIVKNLPELFSAPNRFFKYWLYH